MLSRLGVAISFGEAKVDHVNNILLLAVADEEIIGLHIPMDEMIIMEELEPLDHLVGQHESRLDRELALAVVEQVLETGSEQVHDHRIVVSFHAKPVNSRDASYKYNFINYLRRLI